MSVHQSGLLINLVDVTLNSHSSTANGAGGSSQRIIKIINFHQVYFRAFFFLWKIKKLTIHSKQIRDSFFLLQLNFVMLDLQWSLIAGCRLLWRWHGLFCCVGATPECSHSEPGSLLSTFSHWQTLEHTRQSEAQILRTEPLITYQMWLTLLIYNYL